MIILPKKPKAFNKSRQIVHPKPCSGRGEGVAGVTSLLKALFFLKEIFGLRLLWGAVGFWVLGLGGLGV